MLFRLLLGVQQQQQCMHSRSRRLAPAQRQISTASPNSHKARLCRHHKVGHGRPPMHEGTREAGSRGAAANAHLSGQHKVVHARRCTRGPKKRAAKPQQMRTSVDSTK